MTEAWRASSDLNGDFGLLAEHRELFDGGWTIEVTGDEERFAAFFLQAESELCCSGGFTRTIESAEEDVTWSVEVERGLVAAQEFGELVVEDFDNLLAGFDGLEDLFPLSLFANGFDEGLGHRELDVSFEKSEPDFAEGIVDVFLGDFSGASEVPEGFVERI